MFQDLDFDIKKDLKIVLWLSNVREHVPWLLVILYVPMLEDKVRNLDFYEGSYGSNTLLGDSINYFDVKLLIAWFCFHFDVWWDDGCFLWRTLFKCEFFNVGAYI